MREFVPLQLPPGIVEGVSPAQSAGRWFDGNLVRWSGGNLRPVAGWVQELLSGQFGSTTRRVHSWTDNNGVVRIGVICDSHLYVIQAGEVVDVTPDGGFLSDPPTVGLGGYGGEAYGAGTYGTPRSVNDELKQLGAAWSLDNWGETLVAMASYDGRLLQWDPSVVPTQRAKAVSGAPTSNRFFVVTDERHVMMFGVGGAFNRFAWCSQENINDWNFSSVTNTAGFYDIEPAANIISAATTLTGVLFFTSSGAYLINYVGTPYIYSFSPVADAAIPISHAAITTYGGKAFWYADSGFWTFDGSNASPLACDLYNFVKDNINQVASRFRAFAVNIQTVNEIWFFFPPTGQNENTQFVSWNFGADGGWWSKGTLSRTCGFKASYTTYPIMSDGSAIYLHERGQNYADFTELPYVISGALSTKSGVIKGTLIQCITDNPDDPSNLLYSFTGRNRSRPDLPSANVVGPKPARIDGYIDVRLSARDIQLTLASAKNGYGNWSMGVMLARVADRGSR